MNNIDNFIITSYRADIPTSRAAAQAFEPIANRYRKIILEHLRSCGSQGATHREIEEATGIRGDTARPRLNELVELGHAIDSNTVRRNPGSRRWAIVWVAVACKAGE